MDLEKLKSDWILEESKVLKGWDFSHLAGRWKHTATSWDYDALVRKYKKDSDCLLDMGTGGGEYLLTLNHPYAQTFVTEGYLPNVELCNKTLAPLGITVVQVFEDEKLQFEDNFFDIIINRHESFDVNEVYRVLKPGGIFITQQIGKDNSVDLNAALSPGFVSEYSDQTLEKNVKLIKSQPLDILFEKEEFPITYFYDVGAIVYYAKAIEWEFPGFSVEKRFSELCDMQKQLENDGHIKSREHRYIIVAQKKG